MASIVTNLTCELTTPVSVVFLPGNMFSMDNGGNIINVFVVQNGEPATLGGSVSANVIRSDGTTVAITGAIEGNKAYIILPQACYAVPGIIHIVMKITEGTTITTIAAVTANVYQSSTDAIVDPGQLVPSVAALIAQIEAAVDSIPVDYSGLLATLAADYSSSKTYPIVGMYAWQGGILKRNIVPITTAETYTAAHWTNAVLGDDVTALKGAIDEDLYYHETDTDAFYWKASWRVNSTKKDYAISSSNSKYAGLLKGVEGNTNVYLTVYPGSKITVNAGYTMDYAITSADHSTSIEGQRGISAGTTITIQHKGVLILSVTDGTNDVTSDAAAKLLAKAGLTIDLIVTPVKTQATKNTNDIATLTNNFNKNLYIHGTNTNDFLWGSEQRVNSTKKGYAINQAHYTGVYKESGVYLYAYAGSKFSAKTGYTMDYTVLDDNGNSLEGQRGIAAGVEITTSNTGKLLLSVTDGTSDTSSTLAASELAKAGLNIDLLIKKTSDQITENTTNIEKLQKDDLTNLVKAQRAIARDWHFGFINVSQSMGLGSNHIIPGTKTIWSQSGSSDLNQKGVWMSDGVHPFKGDGVTDMYARTISEQLTMIPPSYRNGVGDTTPTLWNGRNMLWMGTSIPAGSDPDAGSGSGATYPALVASQLGATVTNKAKGSSCVRINASTGEYTGMIYSHFLRSLSRTVDECDAIAADWANIYTKISNAPSALSADDLATMKSHSYENLLVPYLDGTYTMPDLFVIDHGHNDVRPKGIDGKNDLWIEPSYKMISEGILADDEYMTANNYANLKTALGNDLSAVGDIGVFAATLNRNCFKGAVNFIITVILKYNPYARIVIVSDYN